MNPRSCMPPVALVFDGDDTLWSTEQLYDDARSEAAAVVAWAGLDARKWEVLERRIDVANVATFGYSSERFPTSCVQAYEELCASEARAPERSVAERVRQAARTVFEREPPLMSGARETLSCLRQRGIRLALLTKGDLEVQNRRIESSGLGQYFDIIQIVREKSPTTIRAVVAALGADVRSAWMVGNSVRSDILPAIDAGLKAVWIKAHVWEYEQADDHLVGERAITVSALAEIPGLLAA